MVEVHGAPVGSVTRSRVQVWTSVPNSAKSLPPMPSVTRSVSGRGAHSCGGTVARR